jgi:hypothetical protein
MRFADAAIQTLPVGCHWSEGVDEVFSKLFGGVGDCGAACSSSSCLEV